MVFFCLADSSAATAPASEAIPSLPSAAGDPFPLVAASNLRSE